MTCDCDRRKKTKEKILKVLTIRSVNSLSELGLINLTSCKDNNKSSISFNVPEGSDSNG